MSVELKTLENSYLHEIEDLKDLADQILELQNEVSKMKDSYKEINNFVSEFESECQDEDEEMMTAYYEHLDYKNI